MANKIVLFLKNQESFQELISQIELNDTPIYAQIVKPDQENLDEAAQMDLAVIDVTEAGNGGSTLIQELRRRNPALGIMVVTSQPDAATAVYYFNMGADDVIRKPFDAMEFLCRIKARLRVVNYVKEITQPRVINEHLISNIPVRIGEINVDFERMVGIASDGSHIFFTPKEIGILKLLYINKGSIVTRERILKEVWFIDQNHKEITDRVVDTNVVNVRKKIGDRGRQPRYLKTAFGVGYMLIDG